MATFDTNPPQQDQMSYETITWNFDYTDQLDIAGGESIQSATSVLIDLKTRKQHPSGLAVAPAVTGQATIDQVIANLVAGHSYYLLAIGTVSAVKVLGLRLRLDCPI